MKLIPIIGLEVHVQLKTASKMFCSCANVDDGVPANTAICPVCTGQPGALPSLNAKAIELGTKVGLALNCTIPDQAVFDRKNYFYPDLPKGYQISQFHQPIAENGHIVIEVAKATPPRDRIRIGITRAHLEEDAAKNAHIADGENHATYVDYNRAGTPLIEIVSEPELRSPQEAKAYLQEMRAILRAIGASDAEMEKGQMRCDANISLIEVDENNLPLKPGFNPKVEIKNLNSFKAVERALTYEIERQKKEYESGSIPVGATRGWDENKGQTFEQRLKETNADYRYFPEPDLPPQDVRIIREHLSHRMPELPQAKRERLMKEWGFAKTDADFLVENSWDEYAEHVMGELGGWMESTDNSDASGGELLDARKKAIAKLAGGWLTSKLAGILTEKNLDIKHCNIEAEDFAEFLHLLDKGELGSANAQKLLVMMVETGDDPSHLMERHNLGQNMDVGAMEEIIRGIVQNSPEQVAQVKEGKVGVLKWFVGAVMKATEGKANPTVAEEMVKKAIDQI